MRQNARIKDILIVYLLCLLGFSSNALTQSNEPPYKIGVAYALSGQATYWANMQLKGIQLAQRDLAAEGIKVDLLIEDSETSSSKSVTAFNKLVASNGVEAVLGNIWAFLTEPMIPLAEKRKILLISSENSCRSDGQYSFAIGAQVELIVPAFRKFFDKFPNVKKTVVFYFDDPGWGHKNHKAWLQAAKESGVTVVKEASSSEFNPDFKAIFTPILALKPDAIFIAHEPVASTKTLRKLGYTGIIVQSNAVNEALASGGLTPQELEGVVYADTIPDTNFTSRFQELFAQPPTLEAHTGYEALRSAVRALQINRKQPAAALRTVKYAGVAGDIDFTKGCSGSQATWKLLQFHNQQAKAIE